MARLPPEANPRRSFKSTVRYMDSIVSAHRQAWAHIALLAGHGLLLMHMPLCCSAAWLCFMYIQGVARGDKL